MKTLFYFFIFSIFSGFIFSYNSITDYEKLRARFNELNQLLYNNNKAYEEKTKLIEKYMVPGGKGKEMAKFLCDHANTLSLQYKSISSEITSIEKGDYKNEAVVYSQEILTDYNGDETITSSKALWVLRNKQWYRINDLKKEQLR